jgi:uncharacterized protein
LSKLLVLLLVIVVVLWLFRLHGKKVRARERAAGSPERVEDMVRCAHCGIHLPRSESLPQGPAFFCSAEHRREHEHSN